MSPWRYGLVVLIFSAPLIIRIPEMLANVSKLHPETQWTFLGLILPVFAYAIYFHVMYYKLYMKPNTTAPTPSETEARRARSLHWPEIQLLLIVLAVYFVVNNWPRKG